MAQAAKKMEFKPVKFDVTEIAPDAPAGEWSMSIPRGKCKIQGTNKDNLPMIIVPIRLDKTEEDGEEFEKALGTELSTFLVFGGATTRGERMSKLRIRQFCEILEIDLDDVPKDIESSDDLEPFVKLIEGKKFTAWTKLTERKDTGETVTDVIFVDPDRKLKAGADDDDDDDDDDAPPSSAPASDSRARGKAKPAAKGKKRR